MKKIFKRSGAVFLALALLLSLPVTLLSCEEDERPVLAVTIAPLSELVSAVAGDGYRVVTLIAPGQSPETGRLTPSAMKDLADAAVYFTVGVPAETLSILPAVNDSSRVVSLADAAAAVYPDLTIDGDRDPHIWLSLDRMAVMTEAVADALSARDSEQAELYRANADAYLARIESTKRALSLLLSPLEGEYLLVDHPAYGYLAAECGLNMVALESEGKEATAAELTSLLAFAEREGIRTVFYSAEDGGELAEAFAESMGGEAVMLTPLAESYLENIMTMANAIAEGIQGE